MSLLCLHQLQCIVDFLSRPTRIESCVPHTSIVFLASGGLDVDKKVNTCDACKMIKVVYVAYTEQGKQMVMFSKQ